MVTRHQHWGGEDNFFKVHNIWHQCLFYLDLDQPDKAMFLYDRGIRKGRSTVALALGVGHAVAAQFAPINRKLLARSEANISTGGDMKVA